MALEQSSASFYQSSSGGATGDFGGSLGADALENYASYQSSSSTAGYGAGLSDPYGDGAYLGASNNLVAGGGEYYSSSSSSSSYGGAGNSGVEQQGLAGSNLAASSFEQQSSSVAATTYATDAQGLFQDPNPEVIRRPAREGARSYVQRVVVRFLQPPPVPPHGPLIIKEVRPPQPPAPPPLYIRQRPPPPPTLPPLVIREAPPKMPAAVGTQVITKMLPALPVPPRSVIIERLPPLPPKPRDVIVERWLPYRAQQKRQVIIQRAPPAAVQKPRNIIIYYEAPKAQVVRRFQNLGVQRANPTEYLARYGTQLEDSQALVTHARQAGVVEDISPPGLVGVTNVVSSSYENYQSSGLAGAGAGYDFASSSTDGFNAAGGFVDGASGGFSSSSYESSSTYGAGGAAAGGFESSAGGLNFDDGLAGGAGSYQSYSSQQTYTQ